MYYYVVKYVGHFGFIKPWTAVRDEETFSQQFLTPSTVEGMEKKLFPELLDRPGRHKILRHRINFLGLVSQQERTWSKGGFKVWKAKKQWKTNLGVITRSVLLEPHLYLAFGRADDADRARHQHLCLCRNEDLLLPEEDVRKLTPAQFDRNLVGFELLFDGDPAAMFKVGHHRYQGGAEMLGQLKSYGNPIRQNPLV